MQQKEVVPPARTCLGCSKPLPPDAVPQRRYCSKGCSMRTRNGKRNRVAPLTRVHSRAPLTDFARDAGWNLRKDVERLERIFADDRFACNKQQVAAYLRGHLQYAAEVCQDLLGRFDNPSGG